MTNFLHFWIFSMTIVLMTGQQPVKYCADDDFIQSGDRCYKWFAEFEPSKGTWSSQEGACIATWGAHLASFISISEIHNLVILDETLSPDEQEFFIGLRCNRNTVESFPIALPPAWEWSDGRAYDPHLALFEDENINKQDCSNISDEYSFAFGENGFWIKTASNLAFPNGVCAMDAVPVYTSLSPSTSPQVKSTAETDYVSDTTIPILTASSHTTPSISIVTTPGNGENEGWSTGDTILVAVMGTIILLLIIFIIVLMVKYRQKLAYLLKRRNSYDNRPDEVVVNGFVVKKPPKDAWEVGRESVFVNFARRLGSGAFGTVYQGILESADVPLNSKSLMQLTALKKNNNQVAIKMLHESADRFAEMDFLSEIELMKSLGFHERLVNIIACVTETSPPMLIAEFCSNGDLLSYMKDRRRFMMSLSVDTVTELDYNQLGSIDSKMIITQKQQLSYALQIAYGLEYLSGRGFVHRDIAARNMLVDDQDACKIGDFGLCRKVQSEQDLYLSKGGRLPLKWMSPEALRRFEMSSASDVWSFGVLLFEIITLGGSPYPDWAPTEILPRLEAGERMKKPDNCPELVFAIMNECWNADPGARPDFSSLRERVASALEQLSPDENYLRLDAQRDYYLVPEHHDQNVPEEMILQ